MSDEGGPVRIGAALLVVLGAIALALAAVWRTPPAAPSSGAVHPGEVYDPFWAGEEMPPGYRQLLGRDVISPIYQPVFVPAREARYQPDALVIGVAIGDDAHAYPVGELNRREMVNDWMHGTPILVTW